MCVWFVWRQPVNVCIRRMIPDQFWTKPPEGDKKTHLEPQFGERTNMYVLYVNAWPLLHPVIKPFGRGVWISVVYSTHPSSLHLHTPSCRTLLSYYFSSCGVLFCHHHPRHNTVQRGLVAASAQSDVFRTMNGNLMSPALHEFTVLWKMFSSVGVILQMCIITLCLWHRGVLVFAKSLTHI